MRSEAAASDVSADLARVSVPSASASALACREATTVRVMDSTLSPERRVAVSIGAAERSVTVSMEVRMRWAVASIWARTSVQLSSAICWVARRNWLSSTTVASSSRRTLREASASSRRETRSTSCGSRRIWFMKMRSAMPAMVEPIAMPKLRTMSSGLPPTSNCQSETASEVSVNRKPM